MKKELLNIVFEKYENGIQNLQEKDEFNYEDVKYKEINEISHKIAKYVAEKIMQHEYLEGTKDYHHWTIEIDENLSQKYGVDKILIQNDCGYEFNDWVDSNYTCMKLKENGIILYIDIYNCKNLTYGDAYSKILQELYNFERDVNEINNNND